jgi:single-strand DNA-binding protein
MAGINKVILVGHLGADPDLRYTASGGAVCELRLATSESWKDKGGEKQERTEWHRIIVWGKTGEACAKYLAKGRMAYVEGRIQSRSYDDKDGVKKYITEIVASDVQFLGGGKSEGGGRGASRDEGQQPDTSDGWPGSDDGIPF